MDIITTMTITPSQAALVRTADLIGVAVFTDRGRAAAIDPKAPFVVDPRPVGPPV